MPTQHKCDPESDCGFTKADSLKNSNTWFCVYFARGHCVEGQNCHYFHRIPTHDDCLNEDDNAKDIFGRSRHATHKDNMTGIGSFNIECRTIYIAGVPLKLLNQNDGSSWLSIQKNQEGGGSKFKDVTSLLYTIFSPWGEVEDISINQRPFRGGCRAYIRYAHRFYAEFAREAMNDQMNIFPDQKDPLLVRWALDGSGNPMDFDNDAEKANFQISQMIRKRPQGASNEINQQKQQQIQKLTPQQKVQKHPQQLVPQISNLKNKNSNNYPSNKRQMKHFAKQAFTQGVQKR